MIVRVASSGRKQGLVDEVVVRVDVQVGSTIRHIFINTFRYVNA